MKRRWLGCYRQRAPECENRLILPGYLQTAGHILPKNKKVDGRAGNPDQTAHILDVNAS
jgi:hypothetical protein